MSAPFFFQRGKGLAVREIIALVGAESSFGADPERRITGVAALEAATPADLVFLDSPDHVSAAAITDAGACLTTERFASQLPDNVSVLRVRAPYRAFVEVASALFPGALRPSSLVEASGTTPGAFVHQTARIENGVTIDPGAVIGPRTEIGGGTTIGAGAVIGPGVRIGRNCSIGPHVSLVHTLMGDRVIVHPGCRIGQDGFGFTVVAGRHRKVPQLGRVIIQDDVEIGAGTTIDRGAIRDTVIGEGTKIDNLVQIAHNVVIGRHCVLAAQVGISGSVVIGDGVMMGGQAGVADHVTIGDGAALGAQAGLMRDIPSRSRWGGTPARPARQWLREVASLERLAKRSKRRGGAPEREEAE